MAYLSGYSKYKVLTLTGGADGALTDHQLKITVSKEAAMQGDFDDLRFTQADGETLVDAWAELIVTDTSATVWVEFPTTPANTVDQIYRMYYGNASAASDWDGDATFLLFDDFGDDSIDAAKWIQHLNSGTITEADGIIKLQGGGSTGQRPHLVSVSNFSDVAVDYKTYCTAGAYAMLAMFVYSSETYDATFKELSNGIVAKYWAGSNIKVNKTESDSMTTLEDTGKSWSQGNWYEDTLAVSGTSPNMIVKYWHDDVLETDLSSVSYSYAGARKAIDLTTLDGGQSVSWYNDIRVRKYAANPPTYAFGAEQSVPSGNPYWYYNLLKRRN